MVDRVAFQLWRGHRERLVANHQFYVAEAQKRLLAQFKEDAMKADADKFAEEWLVGRAPHFDPDRHDPADAYEQAWDESVSFYQGLVDLRDTTRLSIIAGMYHEWEKQLRDWLGQELGHMGLGANTNAAIWKATIGDIFDFLETWQWPVRTKAYFGELEKCRLVVNVYKHGSGNSFNDLKALAPELVGATAELAGFFLSALDYTNLTLGDADLARFSEAIAAFWQDVPENTFFSQLTAAPAWLEKAVKKDRAAPAP